MKKALTVAGSDSGGGAGIQADLKTFAALQVYGMSAITAVTAQNTSRVKGVYSLPAEFVAEQMEAVIEDIGVDALKTGMLANAQIVKAVADAVRKHNLASLVVDPVMVAQSGDVLLEKEAIKALREELISLAAVVAPNLDEASILVGEPVKTVEDMEKAAKKLYSLGPVFVLLKGGHLEGDTVTDILYDSTGYKYFSSSRLQVQNTHGSGCTYAAAIAAMLAREFPVPEAVEKARAYLLEALECGLDIGKGSGPLHHMVRCYKAWT
ncbi:MAG: bifunctional hydroxymethylpyrimidine kinase/phosphomethylpyrimidine kinase [Bacillota bacterium]